MHILNSYKNYKIHQDTEVEFSIWLNFFVHDEIKRICKNTCVWPSLWVSYFEHSLLWIVIINKPMHIIPNGRFYKTDFIKSNSC